jgi:hypothetical protein
MRKALMTEQGKGEMESHITQLEGSVKDLERQVSTLAGRIAGHLRSTVRWLVSQAVPVLLTSTVVDWHLSYLHTYAPTDLPRNNHTGAGVEAQVRGD